MTEPLSTTDVRASDAERQDVAELLQAHYTTGRLTLTELDERVAAAYTAATRDQLLALLTDLPAEPTDEPTPLTNTCDPRLLVLLCWLCPPAALAYWICTRHPR
jgi:hypothetical protein